MEAPKLPDRKSALLRLAVEDAQKIEKTPGYILDMSNWHVTIADVCHVCMAGAVMVHTLGCTRYDPHNPLDFVESDKLDSIDEMRGGYGTGLEAANKLIRDNFSQVTRRAPWEIYLKAADMLEEAGL